MSTEVYIEERCPNTCMGGAHLVDVTACERSVASKSVHLEEC